MIGTLVKDRENTDLWTSDLKGHCLIVLGHEGQGLSPQVQQLVDTSLTIPLSRGVESLNVAVTAGIICYEAARQRGGP